MSVLSKIFGSPKMTYRGVATQPEACCFGKPLMPRWRGPQVMEDDTESEDVGRNGWRSAIEEFRGEIEPRAREGGASGFRLGIGLRKDIGEAEIHNFDLPGGG